MKALAIVEKGKLDIIELPIPAIGEYEALCKMEACAYCNSTDHKLALGEFCPGVFPSVLGHEVVSTIVKTGSKVRNVTVGDRVFRQRLTDAMVPGGRSTWGGFSEYGVVTDRWALEGVECDPAKYPYDQQTLLMDVPAPEATTMITLMECLDCVMQSGAGKGKRVAVIGSGPVAQAMALFTKLLGADRVVAVGRRDVHRKRFMTVCKVDDYATSTDGIGKFDIVFEGVGSAEALETALNIVTEDGSVRVYGIPAASAPYPATRLSDGRVTQVGATEGRVQKELVGYIQGGDIRLKDWYDTVLPLSDFQKGYDLLLRGDAYKVVLTAE
jgi:threonine dehydrogenase-like Zn-dependent dehydrogenase